MVNDEWLTIVFTRTTRMTRKMIKDYWWLMTDYWLSSHGWHGWTRMSAGGQGAWIVAGMCLNPIGRSVCMIISSYSLHESMFINGTLTLCFSGYFNWYNHFTIFFIIFIHFSPTTSLMTFFTLSFKIALESTIILRIISRALLSSSVSVKTSKDTGDRSVSY